MLTAWLFRRCWPCLLVLLLVAGFSVVTQWTVDGLRAPQVATVAE